ncbi:MAG: low specificity L-threonine aldolase [Xanthomonadales bacterium]|nr:low specificity L-threonine aldolase [Gammaproteobacteria bacterium]MBT8053077.1 low specificity L-threonine aldolase [Gammaproteobacteria bacterium]NND56679.1 low specificity L-threonine aldolase [Xanthomonadales bacterium]NNK52664.1 low specificity L-threonine aldolase [Xanthomonadales bacterium]
MELNFRSDNESPAAPAILAALEQANHGAAWAYADDPWSARLDDAFSELFDTQTTVLPISTGTAANSIALAAVTPPWGSVYCHRNAHILNDEGGAPEFYGNGLRLVPVDGPDGKFTAEDMDRLVRANEGHGVHSFHPSAVSITQSSESGTVYRPDEVGAICEKARLHSMATHMDGARFANAVASLACHPGDITWRVGVQMLSFGASKNGCLAAEALLFFGDHGLQEKAERLRKRSGHLLSKMRFVSAQLLAYIDDNLWLQMAGNANRQAARFADAVSNHSEASLEYSVHANEVFVRWSPGGFERLEDAGVQFLTWPGRDDLARFVFSYCTDESQTEALCSALTA